MPTGDRRGEIKMLIECENCDGTGIYVGVHHHHRTGVVCPKCRGTGGYIFYKQYVPFSGRVLRADIERVFECNPGVSIGNISGQCTIEDFGGIKYVDWLERGKFHRGTEMRKYVCPAWWDQSVGNDRKEWNECIESSLPFYKCDFFENKNDCWERWDKENES